MARSLLRASVPLKKHILGELRIGRTLANLLYGWPRTTRWLFRHCGQALCEAMTEFIMGRKTYRELLARPENYFRLLVNSHRILDRAELG